MRWPLALVAIVACCAGADIARAEDESPAVVPYRPSVATSADLPAPGWPELEAGGLWVKGGDNARSQTTPLLFKLAWSDCWGLLIGTDPYDSLRTFDGTTTHSGGDTALSLKYKLPVDDNLMLGAQLGATLPTARPPIGSGHTAWGAMAIASLDYPGVHTDINLGGTHLGSADEGQGRWQASWAVAVAHPLDERFGVTAEVSGVAQRGSSPQTQGLIALNYNVSRALVLDIGVAAGLSRGAPDRQLMTGMTLQLGHWF